MVHKDHYYAGFIKRCQAQGIDHKDVFKLAQASGSNNPLEFKIPEVGDPLGGVYNSATGEYEQPAEAKSPVYVQGPKPKTPEQQMSESNPISYTPGKGSTMNKAYPSNMASQYSSPVPTAKATPQFADPWGGLKEKATAIGKKMVAPTPESQGTATPTPPAFDDTRNPYPDSMLQNLIDQKDPGNAKRVFDAAIGTPEGDKWLNAAKANNPELLQQAMTLSEQTPLAGQAAVTRGGINQNAIAAGNRRVSDEAAYLARQEGESAFTDESAKADLAQRRRELGQETGLNERKDRYEGIKGTQQGQKMDLMDFKNKRNAQGLQRHMLEKKYKGNMSKFSPEDRSAYEGAGGNMPRAVSPELGKKWQAEHTQALNEKAEQDAQRHASNQAQIAAMDPSTRLATTQNMSPAKRREMLGS